MTNTAELKRDLADTFFLADLLGYSEGICNHFSVAVSGEEELYLINPYGVHWSEMRPHHLLLIDGDGRVLEGEGEVEASARYIHVAGHRANSRHRAILHTHMPYATALTMVEGGKLEMAHQTAIPFWGRMSHHTFGGFALDETEGTRIAEAQQDNQHADIFFLDNHGVTVGAESIAEAFDDLYYLERACRQQVLAQSTGLPLKLIAEEMVQKAYLQSRQNRALYAETHFRTLQRIHSPDT